MKPPIFDKMLVRAVDETGTIKPSIDGCIPMYSGTNTNKLEDSKVNASVMRSLELNSTTIISHPSDVTQHVTPEEKAKIAEDSQTLATHVATGTIHVSATDRANWDAKETPERSQAKADAVQSNLDIHINDYDKHLTASEKTLLNTGIYSKVEIDNKFAQFSNGLDWKEAVQKYSDLEIVYPDAKDGWTANVIEDGVTYRYTIPKDILDLEASGYTEADLNDQFAERYKIVWVESMGYYKKWNGSQWVITASIGSWIAISANAITKATEQKDGLMSKEDYHKLLYINDILPRVDMTTDGFMTIEDFKHLSEVYSSQSLYLELYDCVQRGDPKITVDAEGAQTYKYHGIFTPAERQKLAAIEDEANCYVHPNTHSADIIEETTSRRFITTDQLESLSNMATKAVATLHTDGLMSKEMYAKLADIEYMANNYIHPDSHPATMIVEDDNHKFITATDKTNISKISQLEEKINKISAGMESFSTSGTVITHNHGSLNYSLTVTPISTNDENPNYNVSKIWVKQELNTATVYCDMADPSKETKFTYTLVLY